MSLNFVIISDIFHVHQLSLMGLANIACNLVKQSQRVFPKYLLRTTSFLNHNITQSKMFTTGKVLSKEQIEELQKNPFFDKYAEKIAKLQK